MCAQGFGTLVADLERKLNEVIRLFALKWYAPPLRRAALYQPGYSAVSSTIYDVAELAGVASSTVSRVFSRPELVSDKTKKRVLEAAASLGYRLNTAAGSLTTKQTLLAGLLTANLEDPAVASIVKGVQTRVKQARYLSVVCSSDGDPGEELELLQEMVSRRVDGFVIMSPRGERGSALRRYLLELMNTDVPLVFIGDRFPEHKTDFVTTQPRAGVAASVKYLVELGHEKIALLSGPHAQAGGGGVARLEGYLRGLGAAGLNPDETLIVETDMTLSGGREALPALLKHKPTALVAMNDQLAIGAIKGCLELGISVPNELSVVGFGDIMSAAHITPALTTVRQPSFDLGYAAADLLLHRMANRNSPKQSRELSCDLVIRQTTAAPGGAA